MADKPFDYKLILIVLVVVLAAALTFFFTRTIETANVTSNNNLGQNLSKNITEEAPPVHVSRLMPLIITVKDDDSLKPISKATVKIDSKTSIQKLSTNSKGKVSLNILDDNEQDHIITIEKQGYVSYSFHSILKPGEQEVTLLRNYSDSVYSDSNNVFSGSTTVTAFINDQPASLDPSAKIILRGADDSKIAEAVPNENGVSVFSNVPDQLGYAELFGNGVHSVSTVFSLADQSVEINAYTNDYAESKGLNYEISNETTFILNTSENVSAEIQVYSENKLVYEATLNPLIPSKAFLSSSASASATVLINGIVFTQEVKVGQNNYFNYNSAETYAGKYHLVIKPVFSDGKRTDASISIISGDTKLFEMPTVDQGLDLVLDEFNYTVKASIGNARGEQQVTLDSDKLIDVTLFTGSFLVTINTFDEQGTGLSSQVFFKQKESQSCFAFNGVCQFPAVSGKAVITASKDGFLDSTQTESVDKSLVLNITLVRSLESYSLPKVFYKGFYTAGTQVNSLSYGGEYDLSFTVVSQKSGLFYLRTASTDEDLIILRKSFTSDNVYFVSSDFQNNPSCIESSSFSEVDSGFKWVVIKFDSGITNEHFKVKVSDKLIGKKSLLVSFKAVPSQNFTCHDNTESRGIIAYGKGTSSSEASADVLNLLNTPSHPEEEDALYFGIDKNGNPTVNKPYTNFYVDNIYPADSIKVFTPSEMTLRLEGPSKDCFSFANYKGNYYLTLKGDFLNAGCSIKNIEGLLTQPASGDKLIALITAAPSKLITVSLNIHVDNYKFHVSNDYSSSQYFSKMIVLGSDSLIPLKLSLNLNNQVGLSAIQETKTDAGVDYSFDEPNVKLLMWNGKNSKLSLNIGSTSLASWTFDALSTPNKFPAESLASQSPEQCVGESCCTSFFCSSSQTRSTVNEFEKNSAELFRKTYFRRSARSGMPFNLIEGNGKTPQRSNIISTTQNNNIQELGFPKGSYAPATQKITLKPVAKDIVDFDYDSEIITLSPTDYLNGQCQQTSVLQGFQHSTSGCVYSTKNPTLATMAQTPAPEDNTPLTDKQYSDVKTKESDTTSTDVIDEPRYFNVTYKTLVFAQPVGSTLGLPAVTPETTSAFCDGFGATALASSLIGDVLTATGLLAGFGLALQGVGEGIATGCTAAGSAEAFVPYWETLIYSGNDSSKGASLAKQSTPDVQAISDGLPRWTYARCVGKTIYLDAAHTTSVSMCLQTCRPKPPTVNVYADGDNFVIRTTYGVDEACRKIAPNVPQLNLNRNSNLGCDFGCLKKKSEVGLWNKVSSNPGVSLALQNLCNSGLDYINTLMTGSSIYQLSESEATGYVPRAAKLLFTSLASSAESESSSDSNPSKFEKILADAINLALGSAVNTGVSLLNGVQDFHSDYSGSWIGFSQSFLCNKGGGVDDNFLNVLMESYQENPNIFPSSISNVLSNKDIGSVLLQESLSDAGQIGLNALLGKYGTVNTVTTTTPVDHSAFNFKPEYKRDCIPQQESSLVLSQTDFRSFQKELFKEASNMPSIPGTDFNQNAQDFIQQQYVDSLTFYSQVIGYNKNLGYLPKDLYVEGTFDGNPVSLYGQIPLIIFNDGDTKINGAPVSKSRLKFKFFFVKPYKICGNP